MNGEDAIAMLTPYLIDAGAAQDDETAEVVCKSIFAKLSSEGNRQISLSHIRRQLSFFSKQSNSSRSNNCKDQQCSQGPRSTCQPCQRNLKHQS